MSNKIGSKSHLLYLFVIVLIFANKLDASTDSLSQIWTDTSLADSIRFNAIDEYYTKNLYTNTDSVFILTTYHFDLAEQKQSKKQKALALNKKAIVYSIKGDYGNSKKELDRVSDIYMSLNDSVGIAKVFNNIGAIYFYTIEYQKALNYYLKSLAIYQDNNEEENQASTLMNIGLIHLEIENYDLALQYFNESLYIYDKIGIQHTVDIGVLLQNMGYAHLGKKQYKEAKLNSQKALKLYEELNIYFGIGNSYVLNAKVCQKLNQIDSALFYIKKGLDIHHTTGARLVILKDKVLLANLILPTNVDKALKIGEEVLSSAYKYDDHFMKIDLYNLLYNCYKKKKEFTSALSMLENRNLHSDSLRIVQNRINIIKEGVQNDYEVRIANTQLKNRKARSQLKTTQLIKTYSIAFFSFSIVMCMIIFYRAKKAILSKEKEGLFDQITHLKNIEDTRNQLIQSDKMASVGLLIAGVAHEINNPINFISSGVIGLKKTLKDYGLTPNDVPSDELIKDMNDMIFAIEEGTRRTKKIVKSLRLFSSEDAENYIEVNLIAELEFTLRLLSNHLKKGTLVDKQFDNDEILIYCFPGQLNQVFMNVILNAIHAVADEGKIMIKLKEQKNNVVISISDNGSGIPDDIKQKIFEPFYTTKGIQEGTGLGLSISFGIIKKHKGTIEVKNNNPTGATFLITLPKHDDSLGEKI